MILVPEHEIPAGKAAEANGSSFGGHTFDPPPVYTASFASAPLTHAGTSSSRPTNYLMLDRERNSIKGQYAIDPSISIPASLLPPLPADKSEDERKNVILKSLYNSVDADITLLNPRHPMGQPTSLDISSQYSSVNLKLRTVPAEIAPRTPFNAVVTTTHGSATVWLPRDFHGLVTVRSIHGLVKISDKFLEHVALRHEAEQTHRLFVGDLTALSTDGVSRDEVHIRSEHGRIRVRFLDEERGDEQGKGFLARMFGR